MNHCFCWEVVTGTHQQQDRVLSRRLSSLVVLFCTNNLLY